MIDILGIFTQPDLLKYEYERMEEQLKSDTEPVMPTAHMWKYGFLKSSGFIQTAFADLLLEKTII